MLEKVFNADNGQVEADGGLLLLQISVRQKNPTFTELLVSFTPHSRGPIVHHDDYDPS